MNLRTQRVRHQFRAAGRLQVPDCWEIDGVAMILRIEKASVGQERRASYPPPNLRVARDAECVRLNHIACARFPNRAPIADSMLEVRINFGRVHEPDALLAKGSNKKGQA